MKLSTVTYPSETITFGERKGESPEEDLYMDMWPPEYGGDQENVVDHAKHRSRGKEEASGGSNHAFVDGSVRFLKWRTALSPKNLWAVADPFRNAAPPER